MMQFSLPKDFTGEDTLTVSDRDHHYLVHVLRLKTGDKLIGRDSRGNLYELTIEGERENKLILRAADTAQDRPQPYSINLYQCIPKASRMDMIVRQATEIGIERIFPVISERTAGWLRDEVGLSRKRARWERISRAALRQSGARIAPHIEGLVPLTDIKVGGRPKCCSLFFSSCGPPQGCLHDCLDRGLHEINILIGPEGGLSLREHDFLRESGFHCISLGNTVLKVETAVVSAAMTVKIIVAESNRWKRISNE